MVQLNRSSVGRVHIPPGFNAENTSPTILCTGWGGLSSTSAGSPKIYSIAATNHAGTESIKFTITMKLPSAWNGTSEADTEISFRLYFGWNK